MINYLEKAHSYKKYYDLRQKIIKEFKLHILDRMSYDQFKTIYDKYGKDIKESDFARVIFDVDYIQFQKVKRRVHNEMIILSFEYYIENDFWRIRNTILEKEKTIFDYGLNYEKVQMLYDTYGEKFSLEMFAEHVLGIHGNRLPKLRYNPNQRTEVTDISLEQITYIQETRKVIASDSNVSIGKEIKHDMFQELYTKYCPNKIIDERTFAIRILNISDKRYMIMRNNPEQIVKIFSNFPILPEQLVLLRSRIIEENGFYFHQELSADTIEEIYRDNGGIYSKAVFLQEIFDVDIPKYNKAKKNNTKVRVLSDIENRIINSRTNVSKKDQPTRKKQDLARRHNERGAQILYKNEEIKQKIEVSALNAKNGTFVTEAELLGKKETKREYTRKKVIGIRNAVLSLENYMGVNEIINFFYICNKFYAYDIAIDFIRISNLQTKIKLWSKDDIAKIRKVIEEYKANFIKKYKDNDFVNSDEKKIIASEKKYLENKIDFLCYLILLSGKPEQQDIQLIHQLCKKYNKYKTEFWFLDTCINNLDSFSNKDNYWDSKKKEWIKGIMKQASEVYARGLIRICIKNYNELSEENISKISQTTKLSVEEIKELYEEYKKQVGGETVGL